MNEMKRDEVVLLIISWPMTMPGWLMSHDHDTGARMGHCEKFYFHNFFNNKNIYLIHLFCLAFPWLRNPGDTGESLTSLLITIII